MRKKRIFAVMMTLLMLLTACGGQQDVPAEEKSVSGQESAGTSDETGSEEEAAASGEVELTLWTYPVGGWGNSGTVSSFLASFHRAYPDIRVSARVLSYETGDAEVEEALANGTAPDLILEGPERLVANWGARGLMADLGDIWQESAADDIYESVESACRNEDGEYYVYPICMTTHCMAVNRDLFEAADAWKYIDEETHTWSTEDFTAAVAALREYGVETAAAVYCGGQGGDQGTRALVNNLYGGTFTDPAHTAYTVNSPENIRALELLAGMDGISFDPDMVGTDEITRFCDGDLAMAFCWNVSMEIAQTVGNANLDFDIFPMAFPTEAGEPRLQGGIWGFGVFDNGDDARLEAAKTFIRFLTGDDSQYTRAVLASTYWPVRDIQDIYANDKLMNEYGIFQRYMGDFYQVTPGWAEARTAWWNMLQRVGQGADAAEAVEEFSERANAAAASAE